MDASERQELGGRVPIRILLRNPLFERRDRREAIEMTVRKVAETRRSYKRISVAFYQTLPTWRMILVRRDQGSRGRRTGFVGAYYFPVAGVGRSRRSKAHPSMVRVDDSQQPGSAVLEVVESWFAQLWPSSREDSLVHTLVFDFDDTIADSHEIQVDAWVAILSRRSERIGPKECRAFFDTNGRVREGAERDLRKYVCRLFFTHQDGDAILAEVFPDMTEGEAADLQRERRALRNARTGEVNLFPGCDVALRELSKEYSMHIISATDEGAIAGLLEKRGLRDCFGHVWGRGEPGIDWIGVERKVELLNKLVSILGIPIEHMVYIGDSDGDFRASRAAGIGFVEARFFAEEVAALTGSESLLRSETLAGRQADHLSPWWIKKWEDLATRLREIDIEKHQRRYPPR